MTDWEIKGRELVNCNCDWGCPCQFNALPTHGHCEAAFAIEIEQGHYGDVDLSGLRIAGIFQWPGAIHEGKGRAQPVVDERATAAQREALLKIMSGEDSDPFATMFAVFASTMDTMYEPIFAPIDFAVDIDGRSGHIRIKDVMETSGEPIRNPVTGEEHRARINLPEGFEYTVCEVGSASTSTQGQIQLNLKATHGQFAQLHLNNHGPVR